VRLALHMVANTRGRHPPSRLRPRPHLRTSTIHRSRKPPIRLPFHAFFPPSLHLAAPCRTPISVASHSQAQQFAGFHLRSPLPSPLHEESITCGLRGALGASARIGPSQAGRAATTTAAQAAFLRTRRSGMIKRAANECVRRTSACGEDGTAVLEGVMAMAWGRAQQEVVWLRLRLKL